MEKAENTGREEWWKKKIKRALMFSAF